MADIEVYCVELFVDSRQFGFNVRLQDLAEQDVARITASDNG